MSTKNKAIRKSNPTGLYVVNVYDANGHFTGDKFLVRTLKDAVGETVVRIGEGGFGFTADGYFIFPPFGYVKARGNDGAADFRKYRMAAAGKKNAGIRRVSGAKSKLQKMGERMGRYGKREENPSVKFKPGDIVSVPWSDAPMRILKTEIREDGVAHKMIRADETEKRADGAWYSINTGRQLEGRWYMEETGMRRYDTRKENPSVPATVQRFMDDELYYTKTGKYAPSYLVENRAPELAKFLAKYPAFAADYNVKLRDAWRGRKQNPAPKKGTLYTDHRGLAFYLIPRGRDTWTVMGAAGMGSKVREENLGMVERRGDGVLYVGLPAVGQWWQPTGKTVRAAANYILSQSDDILARENRRTRLGNPDIHIDIGSHNTRAKNPASKIVLVLVGHPDGIGYYTGKGWDTAKSKAIGFDSVESAQAIAARLITNLRGSMHIEVHKIAGK